MHTIQSPQSRRPGQRLSSLARALPAVLALAALAVTTRSLAQVPTFNTVVSYPTGSQPWQPPKPAAVGDFNGDGKLDAIIVDGTGTLRVFLGNGDGTFSRHDVNVDSITTSNAVGLSSGFTPYLPHAVDGVGSLSGGAKAADVNGDGKLDLVVHMIVHLNYAPLGAIAVLTNTGNDSNGVPQFAATYYFLPTFDVRSLTVGDLNGDGKQDFIAGSAYGGLYIYLNNGDGTFTAGQATNIVPIAGGPAVGPGVIADVNGDGKADFIVTSGQANATDLFLGNGDGTLQTPTILTSGVSCVAVADLNKDGKPDLIEALGDGTVSVLLGNGNGTFGSPANFPTVANGGPTGFFISDVNGDGNLDVAVSLYYARQVAILTGNGDGTLSAPYLYGTIPNAVDVTLADFTGDGKPEIASVSPNGYGGQNFDVLINTTPPAITPLVNSSRTTTDGEPWKQYSTTFTPTITGNYTLSFSIPPAPGYSDSTIYLDDVHVTAGATELFRSGFESPVIASGGFVYVAAPNYETGSVTAGDWVYFSTSGIINGAGLAWDSNHTAKEGNQRAFLQTSSNYHRFGAVTTANTMALTAGQTYTVTFWQASRTSSGNINGSLTYAVSFNYVPPADTTPPVITAPANITAEATSAAGAVVTFTATAVDNVDGPVPVVASPASGSTFPIATTIVGLAASDAAHNTAAASFTVTVRDTTAPALTVPASQTLEATSAAGAVATFAASATDAVTASPTITYSAASGSTFALGTTTVNVSAKDGAGNTSNGSFTVTVRDTTAPTISSVTPSSATLWPPNHQMVAITIRAAATDNTGVTSLKIVRVTSSEPDNGLGDGDTAGDIEITGDLSVNLRAERSGTGSGRTYTITVEARDAYGNASTSTCTVFVPKSQGKGK